MAIIKYKDTNGNFIAIPAMQGPQGAPGVPGRDFRFEDFTQEQLELLRGPQGIQGRDGEMPAIQVANTETLPPGSAAWVELDDTNRANPRLTFHIPQGIEGPRGTEYTISSTQNRVYVLGYNTATPTQLYFNQSVAMESGVLFGAAWNDYAEYRAGQIYEAGTCVVEVGDGTLIPSTERLQRGASIISDTYGFIIGKGGNPVAVCGRVLAKYNGIIDLYHAGDPVCSGPNGTIDIMTEIEVREYPDRIIGYVSEIPTYEVWKGEKEIPVNNRIWIRVK